MPGSEECQLCPLPSSHSGRGVSSVLGTWLTLVRAPGWHEAQHWDAHGKQGQVLSWVLLISIFQPELGNAGVLFLCLLEVSGSQINGSWENFSAPTPKSTPLHLILWNVSVMFLWWMGASETPLPCRHIHTLCRSAMLPAEGGRDGRSLALEEGLFFEPPISWG